MLPKPKRFGCAIIFCLAVAVLNQKAFALDKRVDPALSHFIMATYYERLGEVDNSIREYTLALRVDDQSPVIHYNLATNFIKKSDHSKAIDELTLAAKLDPQSVEPHLLLALLYSLKNNSRLATEEYQTALSNASKLDPKNIEVYKSLASLYLREKKLKELEEVCDLIAKLAAFDPQAHFFLGNVYYELKDFLKAEKELKKAIELKPDYYEALNYLGYLYLEVNRNLKLAEGMILKAVKAEPDNAAYLDSLGWVYFKTGKVKEAFKLLIRASTLVEDPVIFEHLGDVYLKIKDIPNARVNWEKSLRLAPDQDSVKNKLEINK